MTLRSWYVAVLVAGLVVLGLTQKGTDGTINWFAIGLFGFFWIGLVSIVFRVVDRQP